jgi:hypothetical protein
MDKADVMALAGRELDAAVAIHVMGMVLTGPTSHKYVGAGWYYDDRDKSVSADPPEYSTDANASALVLAQIERRGLREHMVDTLWDLLGLDDPDLGTHDEFWLYLTASPEAISRAALLACLPEGGE